MIKIECASCRESVEVATSWRRAAVPACGRFVIGGGDPKATASATSPWGGSAAGRFMRLLNWVAGDNPLGLRTVFFGCRVVLSRREVDHLPNVCMRCGAVAERGVRRSFVDPRASDWSQLTNTPDTLSPGAWMRDAPNQPREPWVTFDIPLCKAHAHHFVWQNLSVYLCVAGFVGAAAWIAMASDKNQAAVVAIPIAAVSAVLTAWCVGSRGICAGNFFDEYVEIWGVSPLFIRALAEHRAARLNKDAF